PARPTRTPSTTPPALPYLRDPPDRPAPPAPPVLPDLRDLPDLPDLPDPSDLLRVHLPSRVELVEIQERVEDEEIAAFCLTAPDGVVRKRDHMTSFERHIDDCRVLRDLAAVLDQPRHEQVLRVRVAQDNARACGWRNHVDAVAELLIGDGHGLPHVGARLHRHLDAGPALRRVLIVGGAAPGRPIPPVVGTEAPAPAASENTRDVEDRTVVAPERQIVRVTVGDGARGVDRPGPDDAADDAQPLTLSDSEARREPARRGEIGGVHHREEQSALAHEVLKVRDAVPPEAWP